MKKLITVLLFVPFVGYSQTCIIAIKTKNKIIVGAESRTTFPGINPITHERLVKFEDTVCKIWEGKNINFTISGYPGSKLISFARTLLKNDSITFSQFEERYKKEALKIVLKAIENDNKPPFPTPTYQVGKVLTDIILFGRENDSLKMVRISLVFLDDAKFHWWQVKERDTIGSGETAEIESNNILYDKNTWKNGYIKGIEYLINYVHDLYPKNVGGPINIIEVTKRKTRWIGKKPPCY